MQVTDLQATLKDSFVRQFEETQRRREWEERAAQLEDELSDARNESDEMRKAHDAKHEELQRSETRRAHSEARLFEASGELSLADELLYDMRGAKWSGLRRFFEKYDLPAVTVALFRKVVELQEQLHRVASRASKSVRDGSGEGMDSLSTTSVVGGGLAGVSPCPQLEEAVRRHLCLHKNNAVS